LENIEQNIKTLIDLGLTGSQAKIYLALLLTDLSSIQEIARASKVARSDTYRAIVQLQTLGIVEKILSIPTKYMALPIKVAVEILITRKFEENKNLNLKANKLIKDLKEKSRIIHPSQEYKLVIIPEDALDYELRKLVENAQESISIMISSKEMFRWGTENYANLLKALKRNVEIRIINEENSKINMSKKIMALKKNRFEIRQTVGPVSSWYSIFDQREIVLATSRNCLAPTNYAVQSNNPLLLELAQSFFDAAWTSAIEPKDQAFKHDRRQFDYLFANLTNGFSYNKMIFDQDGKPIDAVILATNKAFIEISGLKKNITGEKVSKVLPDMSKNLKGLIEKYWPIISMGKSTNFEYYSQETEKWFSVVIYSPEKGYFVALAEDISQRKKAEKDLQESEEKFRKAFTTGPDAMVITNLSDSSIVDCNEAFLEMLCYSKEELKDKRTLDLDIWADISDRDRMVSLLKLKGTVNNQELLFRRKNGEIFPALFSASVMHINGQNHVLVAARELSVQKQQETALKKTESSYRSLFSSIDEGFCIIEKIAAKPGKPIDFLYIEANPAFSLQSGIDNVLGRTIQQVAPQEAEQWIEIYNSILLSGRPKRFERYLSTTERTLEVYAFKVEDKTGNHVAVLFKDVTERKKAEQYLKEKDAEFNCILDSSPTIIFYKDKQGKFIQANKAFGQALNMPKENLIGKTVFDLYSPEIAAQMTSDDLTVMKSKKPRIGRIEPYNSPTGLRWIQTDKIPTFNEKGEVSGIIGFSEEITDRKKAEEALKESEEKYRLLAKLASAAIFEIDCKTLQFKNVNGYMTKIVGYSEQELLSINALDLLSDESKQRFQEIMIKNIAGEKIGENVEFEFLTKNRGSVWVTLSSKLSYKNNELCSVFVVALEIPKN
jgi:PAS domain S-box-containing protein